jgi:hypothetical protein
MTRVPQIALLPDGRRLHLQDGPIDLIVEAKGKEADVRAAYEAAARRFTGLLDELCAELVELRKAADPARCALKGVVACRMHAAVAPFAGDCFITPMAAVAGAVAEEILGAMLGAAQLDRAYVNNGGDIATGAVSRSASPMPSPRWRGPHRKPMLSPPSSPTPSICPDIPPSCAVRPTNCSPTAISARVWLRVTSANCLIRRSRSRSKRASPGRANCLPKD